jgi:CHASE2 domain-containing sensor protein
VILGDAGDGSTQDIIQIQVDAALLQQLPKAETELVCRSNPLPQEFCDLLQDERGWDIFFFAGHSATQPDGSGVFYLQHPEQPDQRLGLSFDRFQQSMRKALEQGLQLVILNSCQGWGVIRPLENLQVPQAIIMREAVPDPVAQAFLQRFLQAYSVAGKSLYQAVRSAREKLEGLEVEYPNATWLPVIYQNPAATAPTWKDLCRKPLVSLSQVLLISAAIAIGVTGIRHLGWLQRSEFWAFDRLMQLRPREKQDKRLLIITINKEDIEYQKSKGMELGKAESSYGQSLSDQALEELLFKKLKPHHPAAIGLDIYRDFEVEPKYPRLKAELRQNKHLVVVCGNASDNESLATLPPPEANKDQIGFSDLPLDIDHGVRRQIINAEPDPPHCPTTKSFSFQLAHQYLSAKNIKVFDEPGADQIQIGSVQLKKLVNHDATYHPLDAGTDFMVPLNYRMTEQISPIISLRDLLERANNDQLADLVKNNIVLIGKIDNQDDLHLTSFSSGKVAGVFIHAHMISQLLSAVLDDRPLLWYWPKWGDFLWIWSWAFGSGVIIVFLSRKYPIMITTLTLSSCFGSCFFLLLQAGWVPCIPTGLAILLTNFSLSVVKNSLVRRINK